jgi:phosphoglycolate phosphatase
MLRRTVLRAGGSPADAMMVGDSATDIDTARAAGIPAIAVDFGYTETPVALLGPDCIISHFEELPAAVDGLRAARGSEGPRDTARERGAEQL